MNKRLYKSQTDKALSGVCAGLAEYLNIDVVVVRLLAVILCFMSFGTVLVVYIAAAIIMPEGPGGYAGSTGSSRPRNVYETTYEYKADGTRTDSTADTSQKESTDWTNGTDSTGPAAGGSGSQNIHFEGSSSASGSPDYEREPRPLRKSTTSWILGLCLILLGAYIILEWLFPWLFYWLSWKVVGAGMLIATGVYILAKKN